MAVFPLLAGDSEYRVCDTDLLVNDAARAYWLELFENHFDTQLEAAASTGTDAAARARARKAMDREIALLREAPDRHGRLDILVLDELRRRALSAGNIVDEFRLIKDRENEAALKVLPARLAMLDGLPADVRPEQLVRGLLAGNLFDMGVRDTGARFAAGAVPFDEALAAVPDRPWLFDELDAAWRWLAQCRPGKTVVFADNAGADIVLGLFPMARHLLAGGGEVLIAANHVPALNDVTAAEVAGLLERARRIDEAFASSRLRIIDSGCVSPLIDLMQISDDLADAARGADLILLLGMGRAVESNWSARFTCASQRIAMIKDPQVARSVRGRMYDAIVRFDAPP